VLTDLLPHPVYVWKQTSPLSISGEKKLSLQYCLKLSCNYNFIGADFAGETGAIAPAVKILRGDAPAVTREVAPVNHGAKPP